MKGTKKEILGFLKILCLVIFLHGNEKKKRLKLSILSIDIISQISIIYMVESFLEITLNDFKIIHFYMALIISQMFSNKQKKDQKIFIFLPSLVLI